MFLITMLAIVSRIKDLNDGRCVFCTKTASYDISSIPTGTVHILHSGIKGAPMNSSNVYRTYYVTSPCGSNANTTGCVAGPTASPVAYRPATAPVCQSVGSLKDSGLFCSYVKIGSLETRVASGFHLLSHNSL
eukprot:m.150915 g.150915  ORF g.150915 m.150915 type:complete len:133 (-) comp15030_c0_seq23:23-421(-)